MDAILFALSFEVLLLQMKILEGSAALRLRGWKPATNVQRLQHDKLITDRKMVMETIRKALVEVADTGEWHSIRHVVKMLKQRDCDAVALRNTNTQLKSSHAALLAELHAKRNQWVVDLRNADQKVAILRDKMADDLVNAKTRLLYAEKWLFARFESFELQHNEPKTPRPRQDHECRIHEELIKAYELQIKQHEESLDYWRKRYEIDTAEITDRVQTKCEQFRAAATKRQKLQELFNEHQGEIRGWLNFKRERAARLAREEHLRRSATLIQAWWRGVMVRQAIGQFKYLKTMKKPKGKKK